MNIYDNFRGIYNNDNTSNNPHNKQHKDEQPQQWQNTEYNGIAKQQTTKK